MKKALVFLLLFPLFIACDKKIIDTPPIDRTTEPDESPTGMTLEEFYHIYCDDYRVKDTTGLVVMGSNTINGTHYLSGIQKGKFWIGKFNLDTKEQIDEFVDSKEFETEQKIHTGYGEYKSFTVWDIELIRFIEGNDYEIIKIHMQNMEHTSGIHMLLFSNAQSEKRYFYHTPDNYANLLEWHNGSYLEQINIDNESDGLITCFTQYGDTIFTGRTNYLIGRTNLLTSDVFPVDYVNYITPSLTIGYTEGLELTHCVELGLYYFSNPIIQEGYKWKCNLFITNDNDSRLSSKVLKKEESIWTFQFDITDYSGDKHSHTAKINIETGEIVKLS
jgi:hypothetical protein